MDKPTVGQILFSLNVGNAARNTEQKLTPVRVTKVGRRYFSAKADDSYSETQYHLSNWREKSNYSATSQLYLDEQGWKDEKESKRICRLIADAFQYGNNRHNLAVEKLRVIESLLEETP